MAWERGGVREGRPDEPGAKLLTHCGLERRKGPWHRICLECPPLVRLSDGFSQNSHASLWAKCCSPHCTEGETKVQRQ